MNANLNDGIAAVRRGEFQLAQRLLRAAAADCPDQVQVWLWLALSAPSIEDALPFVRRAYDLDPERPSVRMLLGRMAAAHAETLATTDRTAARALLIEATGLLPNDAELWLSIAAVEDDEAECIEHLRRAAASSPEDTETERRLQSALICRAAGLSRSGDRRQAYALLEEAAALTPDDIRIWRAIAQIAPDADDAAAALLIVRKLQRQQQRDL